MDRDTYIQLDRIEEKIEIVQKTLDFMMSEDEKEEAENAEEEEETPKIAGKVVRTAVEQKETEMKGKYERK